MIFARLYRRDLVNGEYEQPMGFVVIPPGTMDELHAFAAKGCKREEAEAYKLYKGLTFASAKPISLLHIIKW